MSYCVCRFQDVSITELLVGYSVEQKIEFLNSFQEELEARFRIGIEELADMVFGKRPDIT